MVPNAPLYPSHPLGLHTPLHTPFTPLHSPLHTPFKPPHTPLTLSSLQDRYYRAILDRKILEVLLENDPDPGLEKSEKGLRRTKKVNYDENKDDVIDDNGRD